MSSTSKEKFQNDKNPKKKYQKVSQKGSKNLVEAENANEDKQKNIRKNSFKFFDLKDFPELKSPGKFSLENKNFELKNKEWVSVVSNDTKKTLSETSTLSVNKITKKDSVDLMMKGNQLTQTVAKNKITGINKEKKAASEKTSAQIQRNPNKKKRADPIFINFQDILRINNTERKSKQHNIVKKNAQKFRNKELLCGNFLDSSNPKRSRGKHREIKKKKLSNFKMTIIKERILKHKMREKQITDPFFENKYFNLIDTIDFKTEISIYLNELNQKKFRSLEKSNNVSNEDRNAKKIIKQNRQIVETTSVENTKEDLKNVNNNNINEKEISSNTAEREIKFSSKFREYCDNIITPNLNSAVTVLIKGLIKLQDGLFSRDPIKAKTRKRHVSGIREVKKYLTLKKAKMIIIAPNLEKLQMEGSIYDSVDQLKSMAENQNVPYGFALNRYNLGKYTKKNVPISAFAILNYEGLEILYENALRELHEAKRKFSELANKKEKANDINSQIISSLISTFREDLQMSSNVGSVSSVESSVD